MSGIKFLSMEDLHRSGLLQEVNRQFFHPRGLMMSVVVDDNNGEFSFGGIIDWREDPEGCNFGDGWDPGEANRKAKAVQDLLDGKKEKREKELGYIIQPLPDEIIT